MAQRNSNRAIEEDRVENEIWEEEDEEEQEEEEEEREGTCTR